MPSGRISDYSEEVAQEILHQIATTSFGLSRICELPGMPPKATVFSWLSLNPDFADRYARMKELQCQIYAEETIDISDFATPEDFQVARLRIDTRKWHLSKLLPKKYGDKIQNELTGKDGAPLVPFVINITKAESEL